MLSNITNNHMRLDAQKKYNQTNFFSDCLVLWHHFYEWIFIGISTWHDCIVYLYKTDSNKPFQLNCFHSVFTIECVFIFAMATKKKIACKRQLFFRSYVWIDSRNKIKKSEYKFMNSTILLKEKTIWKHVLQKSE